MGDKFRVKSKIMSVLLTCRTTRGMICGVTFLALFIKIINNDNDNNILDCFNS